MNKITVTGLSIGEHSIEVGYETTGECARYLPGNTPMRCTFSDSVAAVPAGVAVIPFLCTVLPMVWLTDAELHLGELDRDFHDCLAKVRGGYEQMYPMLKFGGRLAVGTLTDFAPAGASAASGCMFSGGVDAFSTLLTHLDERPELITVCGADISMDDHAGWDVVRGHTKSTAARFGLGCTFVESNFRTIADEGALSRLVAASGDGWWHGFLHGIGLLGLCAPMAFVKGLKNIYIASSFTAADKGSYTCASDPTIDNHVRFCGARVTHDGYSMDRQAKVRNIVEKAEAAALRPTLRVCWVSSGGGNCCRCEKCMRTIYALLSFGRNPHDYGFAVSDADMAASRRIILDQYGVFQRSAWIDIRQQMLTLPPDRMPRGTRWILSYDFDSIRTRRPSLLRRVRHAVGAGVVSPLVTAALRLTRRGK